MTLDTTCVSFAALEQFVVQSLSTTGLSTVDAATTARALVETDAMGVFTHGTKLLIGYIKKLQQGGYRTDLQPVIEREGAAWGMLDGQSGLGQVGCVRAMDVAIEKAKRTGIAYVAIRNTGHIGAAGYYAVRAARQGLIGMVTGNDIPSVAAPGSKSAVLGSNPLAYAIPVQGEFPILLDIATAAVAGGKIYAAKQRGEAIPPTWLIGHDGLPTTDADLYPQSACLAPMAGHKGYGFGLWCEILSAIIPGGSSTWQVGSWMFDEPSKPSHHNASMIAIDIGAMVDMDAFNQRLRRLIDEIHSAPTAEGIHRVLLPGEREGMCLKSAMRDGIHLPIDVAEKLRLVSSHTGTPVPW